jgi:hypothetical protein
MERKTDSKLSEKLLIFRMQGTIYKENTSGKYIKARTIGEHQPGRNNKEV